MARILLIEDSPTDRAVFSQLLQRHGHQTLLATNAEDGIELARQHSPDLVLMDIILPGMSGYQALRALNRGPDTCDIPVVMVSTKGMDTDRSWGMRQGAKDYFVKPPQESALISRINELVGAA